MKEQGLLAIFTSPAAIKEAAQRVHALGFTKFDAFTPFPIHGIEKKMGIRKSWLSLVTLVMGLAGAGLLYYFQVWTSAVDWPLNVGGKPLVSWPAFIPITFEGMVLIGGISTVVALFVVMRLPSYNAKVLDPRLTNDKFGLFIDKRDPRFDPAKLDAVFRECKAEEVIRVE
jgi:hypothetical protein